MTRSRKRKLQRLQATQSTRSRFSGSPWATLLLAAAPAAFAQDQAQDPATAGALEEVVVTAQKRSENLQKVPLSIQAIGTARLEELHIDNFNDYVKFLPSVASQSLAPGFARVFMRGVASGDNGNHSGPLPSVGTYLDEQPVTTIQGALDIHAYDIARVESLAGPQGTLYGASSQAGTIRIITNKPDPSGFKAAYDLTGSTISQGSGGYKAEGFVNLPISDTAAVRLVGWAVHDSGYIDNVAGTLTYPTSGVTINNLARAKKHYNDTDTYGARAALKIDLNDSWTISPTIMGQEQKSNGVFGFNPDKPGQGVTHFYPEGTKDRWGQAALTIQGKISDFDLVYAGSFMKRKDETRSDYTDYSYFYDACCAYGAYIYDNQGNFINPSQYIAGKDGYTKLSHELRLSSPRDSRFRGMLGLFVQRQVHNIEQRYIIDGLATSLEVTGWPDTWWLTEQQRVDRDSALFLDLNYDLTDKLTLNGGIRFFEAKNSLQGFFGFGLTNGFTSATGEKSCVAPGSGSINGGPCTNLDRTVKEDGSTPRLNLAYQFDNNHMAYATWSKGFRPGGVNRRGNLKPYTADFLTNYEIGWKTSWLNNRLRFNGAVYKQDWKDFQFSFLGANAFTEIVNGGQAEIKGVEADLSWAVTPQLALGGSLAVTDAKLGEFFCKKIDATGVQLPASACPIEAAAPKGTRLPVTPRFKANLTARYSFNVGQKEAFVQGAFVHQGEVSSALLPADDAILGKQASFTLADFSAGFTTAKYSLELFVSNAFDKRAEIYRYAECDAQVCGNAGRYVVINPPRTIGIKFGQKF